VDVPSDRGGAPAGGGGGVECWGRLLGVCPGPSIFLAEVVTWLQRRMFACRVS
jgi:hypothetical protein